MYCTGCGKQLADHDRFCVHCGTPKYSTSAAESALRPFSYRERIQGENRPVGGRTGLGFSTGESAAPRTTATTGGVTVQVQSINRKRKVDALIVNAGLGGFFGLIMADAIKDFVASSGLEMLSKLFAILVVGLLVVKFIEPMAEHIREGLHMVYSRPVAAKSWLVRASAIVLVAGISFAHGMLHSYIEKIAEGEKLALAIGGMMGYAISGVIPAVITWLWLRGALSWPSRASIYGALGAVVILPAYFGIVSLFITLPDIGELILFSAITWTLVALAGGLAIDKEWGRRPTEGILLSTVVCSLCVTVLFALYHYLFDVPTPTLTQLFDMMVTDVLRTACWGLAIMLYPAADSLFAPARAAISGEHLSTTLAPQTE
jgi:zinc-ribbon domain